MCEGTTDDSGSDFTIAHVPDYHVPDYRVYKERMAGFLFVLMREHLPAGVVEQIIRRVLDKDFETYCCGGFLEQYAEFFIDRLVEEKK